MLTDFTPTNVRQRLPALIPLPPLPSLSAELPTPIHAVHQGATQFVPMSHTSGLAGPHPTL